MFKKLFLFIASCIACTSFSFAQVDINKADQAALDGIKGIGPKMSQKILDERKKGGEFKDWNDVQGRVKGIKEKSAVRLSSAGLTVNGQSKNGAPAQVPAPAPTSASSPGTAAAGKIGVNQPGLKSSGTSTPKSAPGKHENKADAHK